MKNKRYSSIAYCGEASNVAISPRLHPWETRAENPCDPECHTRRGHPTRAENPCDPECHTRRGHPTRAA